MGRKKLEINPLSGDRLRYLLKKNNKTSAECAGRLDYEPQHFSYVINGKRRLTAEFAREIIGLFPGTRFEWLMGEDDVETEDEFQLNTKIKEAGAEFGDLISCDLINECVIEKALLIQASKTFYPIINKEGTFPIETLYERRVKHIINIYTNRNNNQKKSFNDSEQVDLSKFNYFESPEQYEILMGSKVVAKCDSDDLKKMNNMLREYLSYLIYKFILEHNPNASRNLT